jgi:chlorite dismutase
MSNPSAPASPERDEPHGQFVQYLLLRVDPAWRRLESATRDKGRRDFARVLADARDVTWHAYSTLGLRNGAELMLWWRAATPDAAQRLTSALLQTGLGGYCEIADSLWGLTRPSLYTKKRTAQEHALDEPARLRYLVVYPFVKTIDWYLMSREARQGMMNEHMRVGHDFDDVRQVLLYSTGLADQEFVVAYETDRLDRHQDLVIALRSTEARRHTLRDTPIYTAIHYPVEDALALLG